MTLYKDLLEMTICDMVLSGKQASFAMFSKPLAIFSALTATVTGAIIAPRNATSSSDLPQVVLNYSTIQAYESGTTSAGTYYAFKNIRYAAPPVDGLRWAAPQDPVQEDSVNDGTWPNITGTQGCNVAEDCLFLDVYVPERAMNGGQKLPVLFWNYGGGWTGGSKNENTPEGLFEVANNSFIFVAYNYRLDIFGVLNGPTLQRSGGISNVAIYDARKALEWVNTYISQFGGDPDEVTNWGFSAGGSQVMCAITAFGGNKWTPYFKRAVVNSPGWVPGAGHAQAERFLQNVTEYVGGCPSDTSDTIECLRQVSFDILLAASQNITSTYSYQMQPRADGVVLPDTAEYLLSIGQFHKDVGVFLGHSAHESNTQSTSAVTDDASFRAMFKTIFPSITDWAIDVIEELYPTDDYSSQGLRFSAAKQHYDIPGKLLPLTNAFSNQTYNFISYLGTATHGSDQTYWWYSDSSSSAYSASDSTSKSTSAQATASASSSSGGSSAGAPISGGTMPGSNSLSSSEILVAKQMQRYLTSFVLTGDPNIHSNPGSGNITYVDGWPLYDSNENVLEFQPSGAGFNLTSDELDSPQVVFWNKVLWY
ncbi:sterol esterase [Cryptococcus neoformans]|nr:sterol esterase [Cryptococcus neoformans var. grubii]